MHRENLRTGGGQIIIYEDVIVLVTSSRKLMGNIIKEMTEEGKTGLGINQEKNKIEQLTVEEDDEIGVMISNENAVRANETYHANNKLLRSPFLSKNTKMNL